MGRVLSEHLSSDYKVVAVSRKNSDTKLLEDNSKINLLKLEPSEWVKLIEEHKPDAVICAQWEGVAKEDRDSFEIQISNLALQVQLAECAKSLETKIFIAFGSQAEFSPSKNEILEVESEQPVTAYGHAKSELHSKLKEIFTESNTRFIWARIFSIYGPSDTSDSLINGIISSILKDSIYEIRDPGVTWSFLHEEDFAKAIKLIISKKSLEGIINVGNPELISLGDLPILLKCNKILVEDNHASENEFRLQPRTLKMKHEGWSPKIEFSDGFTATLKYRQQLESGASE